MKVLSGWPFGLWTAPLWLTVRNLALGALGVVLGAVGAGFVLAKLTRRA